MPRLTGTALPTGFEDTCTFNIKPIGESVVPREYDKDSGVWGNTISSVDIKVNSTSAISTKNGSMFFTEPGEHSYEITEKTGSKGGVTYSKAKYRMDVKITDNRRDIQYDTTEYPVAVTVTRNDTAALNVTSDKQTTGFNFANSKKYTYLKLTKNTPELVGGDTNGETEYVNATMVFRVTYDEVVGTDEDGKDIIKSMTRYVDVAYKASTKKAQVRYLDKIPYGATVTVEEVYSGNYSPDGNKSRPAQYDEDEGCRRICQGKKA